MGSNAAHRERLRGRRGGDGMRREAWGGRPGWAMLRERGYRPKTPYHVAVSAFQLEISTGRGGERGAAGRRSFFAIERRCVGGRRLCAVMCIAAM